MIYRTLGKTMGWTAALGLLAGGVGAQAPLLNEDFREKAEGWLAAGPHGKVERTTDAAKLRQGKSVLEFTYKVEGKEAVAKIEGAGKSSSANILPFDILVKTFPVGTMAKMQSLRLGIKTEVDTPLIVTLSEKGGGRYLAMVWVAKGDWQEVVLTPGEFWLSDDKNDPKDPNGKLDLDQIENVGVTDLLNLFAPALNAADNGGGPKTSLHLGQHSLLIDHFTVSSDPGTGKQDALTLDAFDQGQPRWITLGEAVLGMDKASPLKTPALRVDYKQGDGSYLILIKNLHGLKAAPEDGLVFDFATAKSCRLVFSLEEKNGSRYSFSLAVPGDSEPYHRAIDFSEFSASDGPKDDNDRLDPSEIKSLTITDVLTAYGIAKQKNTLWIGPIKLQKAVKK